jgi:hypothetical protein
MPKKRRNKKLEGRLPGDDTTDAPPPKRRTGITVGNISDISGNISVAGGDLTTHHTTGPNATAIEQLFDGLYSTIDAHPRVSPAQKEDLKADVKAIQSAVTEAALKSEKVDEGFLARRFRNIARITPDVLDVIVATLKNSRAELGVLIEKIAHKTKEEARLPGDSTTDAPPPER